MQTNSHQTKTHHQQTKHKQTSNPNHNKTQTNKQISQQPTNIIINNKSKTNSIDIHNTIKPTKQTPMQSKNNQKQMKSQQ